MNSTLDLVDSKVECCVEYLTCGAKQPEEKGGFRCSLALGHEESHMACSNEIHNIATWG